MAAGSYKSGRLSLSLSLSLSLFPSLSPSLLLSIRPRVSERAEHAVAAASPACDRERNGSSNLLTEARSLARTLLSLSFQLAGKVHSLLLVAAADWLYVGGEWEGREWFSVRGRRRRCQQAPVPLDRNVRPQSALARSLALTERPAAAAAVMEGKARAFPSDTAPHTQ